MPGADSAALASGAAPPLTPLALLSLHYTVHFADRSIYFAGTHHWIPGTRTCPLPDISNPSLAGVWGQDGSVRREGRVEPRPPPGFDYIPLRSPL